VAGRAALPAGMGRTRPQGRPQLQSQRADGRPNAQRPHRQVPWMDWMGMGMTTRASDGKMPDRPGDYESIAAARCQPLASPRIDVHGAWLAGCYWLGQILLDRRT